MHEPEGHAERVFIGGLNDGEVRETQNYPHFRLPVSERDTPPFPFPEDSNIPYDISRQWEEYHRQEFRVGEERLAFFVHEDMHLSGAVRRLLDCYARCGGIVDTGRKFCGQRLLIETTGSKKLDQAYIWGLERIADRE